MRASYGQEGEKKIFADINFSKIGSYIDEVTKNGVSPAEGSRMQAYQNILGEKN